MRAVAAFHGHENAFVLRPQDDAHDFRFHFVMPHREMEMCGHVSPGALWLLRRWMSSATRIAPLSGTVDARFDPSARHIHVSQVSS
ncbi:PhzF family phenazine biosynthesis protein [Paraburkholderia sp. J63]|uniref:PhzF family phenazine biosynthesis protein n=1 Tax=Paraburkholderia sp. J63 TaxID=2805434 RepID=UPI002ABE9FC1|nr:PhzF family phenazine biosynthesis protein [Paraburkholderia sp. J63]